MSAELADLYEARDRLAMIIGHLDVLIEELERVEGMRNLRIPA